jgi:hypothetical protein
MPEPAARGFGWTTIGTAVGVGVKVGVGVGVMVGMGVTGISVNDGAGDSHGVALGALPPHAQSSPMRSSREALNVFFAIIHLDQLYHLRRRPAFESVGSSMPISGLPHHSHSGMDESHLSLISSRRSRHPQ